MNSTLSERAGCVTSSLTVTQSPALNNPRSWTAEASLRLPNIHTTTDQHARPSSPVLLFLTAATTALSPTSLLSRLVMLQNGIACHPQSMQKLY